MAKKTCKVEYSIFIEEIRPDDLPDSPIVEFRWKVGFNNNNLVFAKIQCLYQAEALARGLGKNYTVSTNDGSFIFHHQNVKGEWISSLEAAENS